MEFSAVNPSCSGYRWSSCWGLGFRYRLAPDSRRVRRKPNGHGEKVHIGRAGPFCCQANKSPGTEQLNKQENIKKEGRKEGKRERITASQSA